MTKHGLILIWLGLVLATLFSGYLGIETGMGSLLSAGVLLAITFAKAVAIMLEFMELRSAPRVWKVLPLVWLTAVVIIIFSGYALGHFNVLNSQLV